MKNLFALILLVVFSTAAVAAGFNPENTAAAKAADKKESFYDKHDNAINLGGAGLPLGYGIAKVLGKSGGTGAVVGGAILGGLGMLEDHREAKDNERAEKISKLIYSQTGGGDSAAAEARLRAQTNLTFAEKKRRECEAEYGAYAEAGVSWPHDCRLAFRQALVDAKYVSETNSPEVFHATMRGGGGQYYNGVRLGSRHASYWLGWGPAGTARYNRQNGYYR